MKTNTKTKQVQLAFIPTIYLNFEVSEDQFEELTSIHDLSQFSDIEFLKSQFWNENESQDLELLCDLGREVFEGDHAIQGVMVTTS